jgi:hypothetical protein
MTKLRFEISTDVPRGEVVITNCLAGVMNSEGILEVVRIRAMWDTGSTESAITKKTAEELGLVDLTNLERHNVDTANGEPTSMPYSKDVYFVLKAGLTAKPKIVDIIEMMKDEDGNYVNMGFDAIIGMDIISNGYMTLEPIDDGLGTKFTFICYSEA